MSIDEWMIEWSVSFTDNGILFRLKKERNPVACYSMHEPWGHYAK